MDNSIKTNKTRTYTIVISFILGWCITIAGFIVPPQGEIDNTVLVVLGQALTYCAVGLGFKDYVDLKISNAVNKHES